jgi:hypothetical protein
LAPLCRLYSSLSSWPSLGSRLPSAAVANSMASPAGCLVVETVSNKRRQEVWWWSRSSNPSYFTNASVTCNHTVHHKPFSF